MMIALLASSCFAVSLAEVKLLVYKDEKCTETVGEDMTFTAEEGKACWTMSGTESMYKKYYYGTKCVDGKVEVHSGESTTLSCEESLANGDGHATPMKYTDVEATCFFQHGACIQANTDPVRYIKLSEPQACIETCGGLSCETAAQPDPSCQALAPTPVPTGHADCACLPNPSDGTEKATQANGQPSYPTELAAYGYGCAAHDLGYDACDGADVSPGMPSDWCASKWCKVDPDTCDFRALHLSYTGQPNDYFSYEACDLQFGTAQETFSGNGWVGRCKNCAHVETGGDRTGEMFEESFCSCGGMVGCPCIKMVQKATQATDKPAYPTETPSYGYGCKAHDSGALRPGGSDTCANSTMTSAGEDDDWCEDKWCIVDKDNCDLTNILLSGYTGDTTDYFTYLACDASFSGNNWVGRCEGASGWNTDDPCPTPAPTAAPTAPSPAPTDTDSASKAIPALICGAVFAAVAAF